MSKISITFDNRLYILKQTHCENLSPFHISILNLSINVHFLMKNQLKINKANLQRHTRYKSKLERNSEEE